jgi:phosphoribosylformylglycinamidine cyclo-ligase
LPVELGAALERRAWTEPRIFEEIRRLGQVEEDEMDRVFNRGVGMAIVLAAEQADTALAVFEASGVVATVIGRVTDEPGIRYA